ncbi:MAG: DUF1990 family protein, partial [Actinobacteria bacterium]|nr:DUF1990 family protein [Actinomycetota bacterium]
QYEFTDARIVRAVYRSGDELLGRNMLLAGRFCGLRFYLGVRITGLIGEARHSGRGREQVWGWYYQTLQGHLEQGLLSYEVIKNLGTGQVSFRVAGYSRQAPISSPVIRWGFRLFGRWTQERFYRNIQRRMYRPGAGRPAWSAVAGPGGPDGRHRPGPFRRSAASNGAAGSRTARRGKPGNPTIRGRKDDGNENGAAHRT